MFFRNICKMVMKLGVTMCFNLIFDLTQERDRYFSLFFIWVLKSINTSDAKHCEVWIFDSQILFAMHSLVIAILVSLVYTVSGKQSRHVLIFTFEVYLVVDIIYFPQGMEVHYRFLSDLSWRQIFCAIQMISQNIFSQLTFGHVKGWTSTVEMSGMPGIPGTLQ